MTRQLGRVSKASGEFNEKSREPGGTARVSNVRPEWCEVSAPQWGFNSGHIFLSGLKYWKFYQGTKSFEKKTEAALVPEEKNFFLGRVEGSPADCCQCWVQTFKICFTKVKLARLAHDRVVKSSDLGIKFKRNILGVKRNVTLNVTLWLLQLDLISSYKKLIQLDQASAQTNRCIGKLKVIKVLLIIVHFQKSPFRKYSEVNTKSEYKSCFSRTFGKMHIRPWV